jgi:hypothetical protein
MSSFTPFGLAHCVYVLVMGRQRCTKSMGYRAAVMMEQHYGSHIVLPGFDQALRWQITGDNGYPPSPQSVQRFWREVQAEFPNAELQASTLDNFAEELWQVKDQVLPLVTQEIGK